MYNYHIIVDCKETLYDCKFNFVSLFVGLSQYAWLVGSCGFSKLSHRREVFLMEVMEMADGGIELFIVPLLTLDCVI